MKRTYWIAACVSLAALACTKNTENKDNAPTPSASPTPTSTAPTTPGAPNAAVDPGDIPPPPDVAAPPADAIKTPSGLACKVLQPGTGTEKPGPTDKVTVKYTGWTTDGKMFDTSEKRGKPATFPLNRVIKGWTEGVGMMTVGEKRRFWIPVDLAYNNRPGRPAGMLVFDVELVDMKKATPPPETPPDVAAIPKDAKKEKSGLASRVLAPGKGTAKPKATDEVEVHYSGWTTDGKLFDSSISRGEPARFRLNGVIAGWTEGVGLMVEGEKRRFWIPEALAYKGQPGAPAGMLVFDVELLKINPPGGHGGE